MHEPANREESLGVIPPGKRQRVMDRLTEAFSFGDLDMMSYERRVDAALQAASLSALDDLVADLPARAAESGSAATAGPAAPPSFGTKRTICIMGDRHLSGNWLQSGNASTFTVMGSTNLDLCGCELPPGPTCIEVFTLMGDTHIIVPATLPVRFEVSSFMADSKVGKSVNQDLRGAHSWVEIRGTVVMGDVKVTAAKG